MSNVKMVEGAAKPTRQTKLLNVGRGWANETREGSNMPVISCVIDRDLGAEVNLQPNDRILFFPNSKREGKRDADFRLAVEVPTEVADSIIESQRSRRSSKPA